jgi:PAS domain S-box-containing protein
MINVLYVDDEAGLLEIGKVFLEMGGEFSIDTRLSAQDALASITSRSYDAIVSDYQMPEMDGIAFLRAVRAAGNDIPFILFTGRGREEIVIMALNEGADFYLQKGGDPTAQFAELAHKVRQAVRRKEAERSLQDSQKRLSDIIDFLPDATFAIDRSGHVIAWNRAVEKMTGVVAAEILGKGDFEYSIAFYGARRKILIDLIFESDEVIAQHYGHIIHDKGTLIAETTLPRLGNITIMGKAGPFYNRNGEIVGAIESVRDITSRVHAEQELRAAYEQITASEEELRAQYEELAKTEDHVKTCDEKYQNVITNTPVGIHFYELRPDGALVFTGANPAADKILKVSHALFIGKTIEEAFPGLSGTEIPAQYRKVAESGGVWHTDQSFYDEGSISGAYTVTAFQLSFRSMAAMFVDITELARAERARAASEARIQTILEKEPLSLAFVNLDGTLSFRNEHFTKMLGYTQEDVPNLELWWQKAYPDPAYRKQVKNQWEEMVRQSREEHRDIRPAEYRVTCKNGEVRILEISGITIDDGFLATFVDLTRQKEAEQALNKRLVALTRPLSDTGVSFEDLFDLDEIQTLQDEFALATGVAALLTLPDGTPVTKPSNFCRLCSGIVRRTPQGRARCNRSDAELGKLREPGKPYIHTCLSAGLWGAGATIVLGGRHIANWLIGQVRNEAQSEEAMRAYARELGADETDFISAFNEVPVMSAAQFEAVARAFQTLADQIAKSAYQNLQQARFIAERIRAEEQLRDSEEKFRLFIEHAPAALAMFDRDMRYLAASHRWIADYHLSDHTVIGRSHYEIFPEISEEIRAVHRRSLAGEIVSSDEDKFVRNDGTVQWLAWEVRPWYTTGNSIGGIIIFSEDITERKVAEEGLRNSEQRYRDLFEISNAVMLIVDPATMMITQANAAAYRFYGYEPGEMRNLPIAAVNTLDPKEIRSAMSKAKAGDGAVFNFRHRKKSGEIREVEVFSAPVTIGGRSLLHSIVQDITDRKRAEGALLMANKKLKLLSGITRHDIKNQLTVLQGYLQLSEGACDNPDEIRRHLARELSVADVINRQISFTRDYEDLGVHSAVWQDVCALVSRAQGALAHGEITVECQVSGVEVFADPLLEKVFYNLLDNSLRYGGSTLTAIRIAAGESGENLRIVYEDDGDGIAAGDKKQLFTRGFGHNTGLGLFLSREILEITGITITENGEPGRGARFEMIVPKGTWRTRAETQHAGH